MSRQAAALAATDGRVRGSCRERPRRPVTTPATGMPAVNKSRALLLLRSSFSSQISASSSARIIGRANERFDQPCRLRTHVSVCEDASAWAQKSQIWDQILLMDLVSCGDERAIAWPVPSDPG